MFINTNRRKSELYSKGNECLVMDLGDIISLNTIVSEECMTALKKAVRKMSYKKDECIVQQGIVNTNMYFFSKGMCRLTIKSNGEESTVLFNSGEGDVFFSVSSLLHGKPSVFSIYALESTELWVLDNKSFVDISTRFPELKIWMCNLLMVQLYGLEQHYLRFGKTSPWERFKNYMQNYSHNNRRYISSENSYKKIPLKYIAQYLGITQSTLSHFRNDYFQSLRDKK